MIGFYVLGESGALKYNDIVINNKVVCKDPWVSIEKRPIDCDQVGSEGTEYIGPRYLPTNVGE